MFRQGSFSLVLGFALLLMVLTSAGISSAHDTGSPHTHDAAGDAFSVFHSADALGMLGNRLHTGHGVRTGNAPVAFLIVPIGGDFFPFHWLWHTMNGEIQADNVHLMHEVMHWYDIPHPGSENLIEEGGDQSTAQKQVE